MAELNVEDKTEPESKAEAADEAMADRPQSVRLVAVLVALLVSGVLLFLHHRSAEQQQVQGQAALAASRQIVTDLTSIGSGNAQQTIARLNQESIGSFHSQIVSYAGLAQSLLQQSNVGSTGTVTAAGIEKNDSTSATALLTVTAVVSNDKLPSEQPLSYRLSMQLQRQGDRWVASDITFVP
jgi:Mce-associated membrane protein